MIHAIRVKYLGRSQRLSVQAPGSPRRFYPRRAELGWRENARHFAVEYAREVLGLHGATVYAVEDLGGPVDLVLVEVR